jgi:hypothetical protein
MRDTTLLMVCTGCGKEMYVTYLKDYEGQA